VLTQAIRFLVDTDKRGSAGALLAISITVAYFPLARLAPLINRGDGNTADSNTELALLIGNLCAVTMGIMGMTIGGMSLVHDYSTPFLTSAFLIFEQTALIPWLSDIVNIGQIAADGAGFIPPMYNPTSADFWFVGAMGMIGAATFCLFLFGGLAFLGITLHSFQLGKPHNGAYYRTRLVIYSLDLAIAGLAQLALGSYIIVNFGSGPLPQAIGVAMFVVHFPEIAVFVGLIFFLNGCYGMYRGIAGVDDHFFSYTMWFQYLCALVLMTLVQTSYAPGGAFAQAAPTIANLIFGVHLVPIYMDYMGRSVPDDDVLGYYKINSVMDEENMDKEVRAA
jgi:hypothetical protein